MQQSCLHVPVTGASWGKVPLGAEGPGSGTGPPDPMWGLYQTLMTKTACPLDQLLPECWQSRGEL